MKFYILYIILFLSSINLKGQIKPDTIVLKKPKTLILQKPEISILYQQKSIRNFDISNELPNLYITTLTTDKYGRLWFGTYGGGCGYYNGEGFYVFTQSDGLPSNYIQKIFEDSKGRIWAATYENGVCYLENNKWHILTEKEGFPGKLVWNIAEDKKGNLWFAVEKAGICMYDGKKFITFSKKEGLCSNMMRTVFCDSQGRIWAGSDGWGVSIIENGKIRNFNDKNGLTHNRVNSILEWNNKIWFGTYGGGLCYFADDTIIPFNTDAPVNLISSINLSKTNKLLVATSGNGLCILDGNTFQCYSTKNGLSNDVTIAACDDKYGNIWIGSYGGGISKIINVPFSLYNEKSGLPGNVAKAFLPTEKGMLISILGKGLALFSHDTLYNYSEKQGIVNNYILSLEKGKENEWWAATSGSGLIHHTNGKYFKYTNYEGLPGNYLLSLLYDSQKRLWVGSYGYGFGYLKNDTVIWFKTDEKNKFYYIFQFKEYHGTIYIGTNNGLYQYSAGSMAQINLPEKMGKDIKSILLDKNGRMWIGTTGKGLWIKDSDRFEKVLIDKDAENIESLIETNDGNIFAGVWNGIIQFCPAKAKTNNSFKDYNIKRYTSLNGFPAFNCITNSLFCDTNNSIWLGTGQGIVRFNNFSENDITQNPVIILSNIQNNFKNINWQEEYKNAQIRFVHTVSGIPQNPVFKYNFNHLTFNLEIIDIHFPQLCSISYRLKGFENDFSPPVKKNKITYTNIPPGKYCLEIYTINEDGIKSDTPFQYSFEILKPWWNETWFYILTSIFILFCFYLFYRIRVASLKKRQIFLENEIAKATNEIREKNEELKQQNFEITSQRNEIESQRNTLQIQKEELEHIHGELKSSIRYAQQIQKAMLPSLEIISSNNMECFVLFEPRDIVSGDFYWAARIENQLIIIVADCTGHGVPGAFMSMLGIALLKEIVVKEKITATNLILDKLRKEIIRALGQTTQSQHKDGMDMTIINIRLDNLTLQMSGANNPLYVVKSKKAKVESSENDVNELFEIKPNKMPVAIFENMLPFSANEIQLSAGDCIYLTTDGFLDQFGGPINKKFMAKRFKELIRQISNKNSQEQYETVFSTFKNWKGVQEQIDDVTVMGIKIK